MPLVIFDIDGTLTNTKAVDDMCFLKAIQQCWNFDLGSSDWSRFKNVTDSGLGTEIYQLHFSKKIDESDLLTLREKFTTYIVEESLLYPEKFLEIKGASHFIRLLQENHVPVAFATGGWKTTAALKLKFINIELEDFPHATSNDHYSREKILRIAIERAHAYYGTDFKEIFYIGDGAWDYEAATSQGLSFIGIDSDNCGKLIALGAKNIFKNYSNTSQLLQFFISTPSSLSS